MKQVNIDRCLIALYLSERAGRLKNRVADIKFDVHPLIHHTVGVLKSQCRHRQQQKHQYVAYS